MYVLAVNQKDTKCKASDLFPVDSIESTCIAVPFYPHQSLVAASQWLILVSRGFYQKFLDKLNTFKNKK